jgi:hypothetical protein
MNEVLEAMLMTKLKTMTATAVLALLLGAGGLVYQAAGQQPAGKVPPPPKPTEARSLTELEILRREVEILKLQMELLQAEVRTLKGPAGGRRNPSSAGGGGLPWGKPGQRSGATPDMAPPGGQAPSQNAAPNADQRPLQDDGRAEEVPPPPQNTPRETVGQRLADAYARGAAPAPADPNRAADATDRKRAWAVAQFYGGSAAQRDVEAALKAFQEAHDNEAKLRAAEALEKALQALRQQLKSADNNAPANR